MNGETEEGISYEGLKKIIIGRVTRDVEDGAVPMDVGQVEVRTDSVDSLGKGPRQGGLGKGGAGRAAAAATTAAGKNNSATMPKGACAKCWQMGHWKNECPYEA